MKPAAVVVAGFVAVLTTACSSDTARSGALGPATAADDEAWPFEVVEVDQLDAPWAMAFLPGTDHMLITERTGELHLRDTVSGNKVEVSGVPRVEVAGQGGLGDVVPGPTYEDDGLVYLSWVEAGDEGTGAAVGRGRLEIGDGSASLEDVEVLWRQPKVSGDGHFSHRIAFSPDGEHLFVSSGDRQLMDPAQDTSTTLGSILRLTLDGEPAPGNPLAGQAGASPEIWSWGHRNPLGLEFAPDGTLWSSEMGPEGGDELNVIEAGSNYGWPEASDGSHYGGEDIPDHAEGDGYAAPATSWNPSISPGSLLVHSGELFPEWEGDAFLGALSGEALVRVDLDGTSAGEVEVFDLGARIRAVEEGPDGAIWLLQDEGDGKLLRLTPAT